MSMRQHKKACSSHFVGFRIWALWCEGVTIFEAWPWRTVADTLKISIYRGLQVSIGSLASGPQQGIYKHIQLVNICWPSKVFQFVRIGSFAKLYWPTGLFYLQLLQGKSFYCKKRRHTVGVLPKDLLQGMSTWHTADSPLKQDLKFSFCIVSKLHQLSAHCRLDITNAWQVTYGMIADKVFNCCADMKITCEEFKEVPFLGWTALHEVLQKVWQLWSK